MIVWAATMIASSRLLAQVTRSRLCHWQRAARRAAGCAARGAHPPAAAARARRAGGWLLASIMAAVPHEPNEDDDWRGVCVNHPGAWSWAHELDHCTRCGAEFCSVCVNDGCFAQHRLQCRPLHTLQFVFKRDGRSHQVRATVSFHLPPHATRVGPEIRIAAIIAAFKALGEEERPEGTDLRSLLCLHVFKGYGRKARQRQMEQLGALSDEQLVTRSGIKVVQVELDRTLRDGLVQERAAAAAIRRAEIRAKFQATHGFRTAVTATLAATVPGYARVTCDSSRRAPSIY